MHQSITSRRWFGLLQNETNPLLLEHMGSLYFLHSVIFIDWMYCDRRGPENRGCLCVCVSVCGYNTLKVGPCVYKKTEKWGPKKKVRPWGRTPLFLDLIFVPFSMLYPKKSKIVQGPTFRVGSFTLETYTGPYSSGFWHTQGPTFRAPLFANWHCSGPMARQVKPKYISRLQCNFNVLK